MKLDEFAFLNQQLGAMLREGIPLEGALRKLCAEMRRGTLRTELEALEADLSRGTPLAEAIATRRLPALYKRMVMVGARSQDLAGVLTLLADYYHEQNLQMTRLKGLMTYPLIVLTAVFALSLTFHIFMQRVFVETWGEFMFNLLEGASLPAMTSFAMPLIIHSWVFPLAFGLLLVAAVLVFTVPGLREQFRWRVPGFRDASLAKVASTMSLLLDRSVPLPEAVALIEQLESRSAASRDLEAWRTRLTQGVTRFSEVAAGGRVFPPLFVWLAHNAGASLADGFRRAGEIYRGRAAARADMMLHASLPVAVLALGALVVTQAFLMLSSFLVFVSILDQLGG